MTNREQNALLVILLIILGFIMLIPGINDGRIGFTIRVISYVNFILCATSLCCLKQFFWPGDKNRTPFHAFHIIFTIIFYSYSWSFLVHHRDYYEGYSGLSTVACISKFALRWDIFSVMFWITMFALLVNIIYIMRHRTAYLQYN